MFLLTKFRYFLAITYSKLYRLQVYNISYFYYTFLYVVWKGELLMQRSGIENLVVKIGLEVKDWETAIKEAGKLLLDTGGIQSSYIDKMIENVKELGPYIVIAPGIAIAHARPEDGVNFQCFSLVTLKEPVEFGSIDNDPVKLLIVVAAEDDNGHLDALKKLVAIINDEEKYNYIINCNKEEEIIKLFSN